jgi:hypothetical protein
MSTLRLFLVVGWVLGCTAPQDDEPVDAGGGARVGNAALLFWGEGGVPPDLSPAFGLSIDDLVATLEGAQRPVTKTAEWPADLLPYRVMFWYLPGATKSPGFNIPADRIAQLAAYLRAGGRLVIAGEISNRWGEYDFINSNEVIDRLMALLGVNLRIANPAAAAPATACSGRPSDPLLAGVDMLAWNAAHPLGVGPPASWMTCDTLAVQSVGCGEVVLIGDTQPISGNAGGNRGFIVNLATVPPRAACQ